jgi:excisionase family DNA binding protein
MRLDARIVAHTRLRQGRGGQAPAQTTPLAVSPREACRLMSIGLTHLYALLGAAELRSYRDGRARRITMRSIEDYVSRRLAANNAGTPRRRDRPRKDACPQASAGTTRTPRM